MLSYDTQLSLKRDVIVKAYKNFSGEPFVPFAQLLSFNVRNADLPPSLVPEILPTMGSLLQYGYRTKITPHFDRPQKKLQAQADGSKPDGFNVGFNRVGTRHVLDIEVGDFPLATYKLSSDVVLRNAQLRHLY